MNTDRLNLLKPPSNNLPEQIVSLRKKKKHEGFNDQMFQMFKVSQGTELILELTEAQRQEYKEILAKSQSEQFAELSKLLQGSQPDCIFAVTQLRYLASEVSDSLHYYLNTLHQSTFDILMDMTNAEDNKMVSTALETISEFVFACEDVSNRIKELDGFKRLCALIYRGMPYEIINQVIIILNDLLIDEGESAAIVVFESLKDYFTEVMQFQESYPMFLMSSNYTLLHSIIYDMDDNTIANIPDTIKYGCFDGIGGIAEIDSETLYQNLKVLSILASVPADTELFESRDVLKDLDKFLTVDKGLKIYKETLRIFEKLLSQKYFFSLRKSSFENQILKNTEMLIIKLGDKTIDQDKALVEECLSKTLRCLFRYSQYQRNLPFFYKTSVFTVINKLIDNEFLAEDLIYLYEEVLHQSDYKIFINMYRFGCFEALCSFVMTQTKFDKNEALIESVLEIVLLSSDIALKTNKEDVMMLFYARKLGDFFTKLTCFSTGSWENKARTINQRIAKIL